MDGGGDIDALQHPVAADVGEQDRSKASVLELAGEIDRRDRRYVRPAARGDHAVLRIDRDGDASRIIFGGFAHKIIRDTSAKAEEQTNELQAQKRNSYADLFMK